MFTNFNMLICFLFVCLSLFSLDVNGVEPVSIESIEVDYNLDLDWNFSINDEEDNKLNMVDYTQWYKNSPTGWWELEVPEAKNFFGNAWYKLPLYIKGSVVQEQLSIYFPNCYGGYKVYFNEVLIYNSERIYGSKPVTVNIPISLIETDQNILTLRVNSFSGWGGFSGYIEIGSQKRMWKKLINSVIRNVAISFISFFMALYFILHYLFRRKEQYNLFFAGLCLSVCLFIMGFNGLWYYIFDYAWAYWVLTFLGGIGMYLLPILFIHSFYGLRLKLTAKIFSGFYVFLSLFIVTEYLITGEIFYFNKYLYLGFNLSYIVLVIYLTILTVKISRDRFKYSKLMLVSIGLLALSFVYSMLCFSLVIVKPPLIGEGFFLMAIVFSIVLAQRFAHTHDQLEVEYSKNVELNLSLEDRVFVRTLELKGRGQQILESLEYASRIQTTMLPSKEVLDNYLSDFYTIFKPKDIVGGDSYWFYKYKGGFLFGLIDCTGHGVPGAILSTTANTVLERIASHIVNNDPAKILYELNRILKRVLSQENPFDIADDGLDIGLLHYNFADKMLTFAGSKIRMHVIDEMGDLKEFLGDRQGIGYKRSRLDYNYTNHKMLVTPETSYYMTTDGYLDQNGGNSEYGFGWKKYLELITSGYKYNMMKQKDVLVDTFEDFRGLSDQRDDVTLLGFKILTEPEANDND